MAFIKVCLMMKPNAHCICSQAWQSTADTKQMTKVRCIIKLGWGMRLQICEYWSLILKYDIRFTKSIAKQADDTASYSIRWWLIYLIFIQMSTAIFHWVNCKISVISMSIQFWNGSNGNFFHWYDRCDHRWFKNSRRNS